MRQVADGVYWRPSFRLVNLGVVSTTDGVVLVDTPMLPSLAQEWRREVAEHVGPIRYILNTDHLADHVLGNLFIPGDIIAHDGTHDKMRMTPKAKEQLRRHVRQHDPVGAELLADFEPRYPNLMLYDRMTMYLGDRELEFIHLPGHTANNVGLFLPDVHVLFAGDTVVNGYRPYLGLSDIPDWVTTLQAIKVMEVELIIPGRGEPLTPDRLDPLIEYLNVMQERVRRLIEEGRTRDEVVSKMMAYFEEWPVDSSRRDEERNLYRQGIRRIYDRLMGTR
ncbi:MAG: MBL fold metallo-hydrolase [Ardenticatenia bacterium]|nr:MBL fold metallo-hydrolase [Ardenticatenia bacterium]